MNRLTKWVDGEIQENHDFDATVEEWKNGYRFRNGTKEIMSKLAAYEDSGLTPEQCNELAQAEKQGLLEKLPCKVGDKLWYWCERYSDDDEPPYIVDSFIVHGVALMKDGWYVMNDDRWDRIGTQFAYLTREEAEAEIRGRHEAD